MLASSGPAVYVVVTISYENRSRGAATVLANFSKVAFEFVNKISPAKYAKKAVA